jgi:aryl-alcohol dehydrogenase-like predicted oxidoreductase
VNAWAPVIAVQLEYSLAERSGDREMLPMAEALGLAATLWSPLGGGFLTGKYRGEIDGASRLDTLKVLIHSEKSAHETAVLDAVLEVALEFGTSPTHVAIAWLRAKAGAARTALIPILGPRTLEQLTSTLGAVDLDLEPQQVARLDQASSISLGIPHEQRLRSANALAGGVADRLQAPKLPVA